MAFIESSPTRHGASSPDASFVIAPILAGDFAAEVLAPFADAAFDGSLTLDGDFAGESRTPGDDHFNVSLELDGDFAADTELVLVEPPPLTRTVAPGAFANQRYAGGGGRLFVNNVLTPFTRAEINAPAGSLGKSLSINLVSANLAQLPAGATFKFQIGRIVAGAVVWTTILDGGKLSGRQFQMTTGRDSLSFSTFETNSRLNKYPRNNLIVFDAAKANVATGEIEPLPTNTNEVITTAARSVAVLTLYKLLNTAFVEGCGFASVETDLPNYAVARCDFSVVNSYHDAVKQFIGMYEPQMAVDGDALRIQKTIDPLPPGYTPNAIYASVYPSFSENLQNQESNLDGYILNYTSTAGSFYVDRNLPTADDESGTFGAADFREITIQTKMRDWFETGNPIAVRSELKQEIRETRRNGVLIDRETRLINFDRLGRAAGYTNTVEKRMPDISNNGLPALLKTSENSQKIVYKTNPFAPRQTIQSKIETSSKALLAVDSENTALDLNGDDAPYPQNYEKVFEAGNLKKEMLSAFQTLETTTEYFRPQANGQIEVRVETFDALRGKLKPSPPVEVRSGDISIPNFSRQQTKTVFRAGVTQATRTGRPEPLNVGELPLFFAEPLATWLLANPRITGQIELTGWDESVERGVSFNLRGRAGEDLGNFLTRGYRVVIEPQKITTSLEALKV